jgi:hypothetical protein
MEAITVQNTSKCYTTEFDLEEGFLTEHYQRFQFTGQYSLTN